MRQWIYGLAGVLTATVPAFSQTFEKEVPNTISPRGTLIEWLLAGAFLIGCMVVAFKPAKRAKLE